MKTWMVAIPVDVSWARAPEKTSRAVALIWKYLGFPMTFLSFGQRYQILNVSQESSILRHFYSESESRPPFLAEPSPSASSCL